MLDPSVLTLRDYARQVIDAGFEHTTAASHCVTLGMQPPEVQREVSALVAEAGMAVFPLPQTNLFLQGREHPTATPRGLTAVRALQEAGAVVAAGADNVQDPFNLVGRSDPLETAALMIMAGHQLPDTAYEMVSNDVRRAIGLQPAAIEPGAPADLLAIDAPSVRGAIADAPMSRRVFRRGRAGGLVGPDHRRPPGRGRQLRRDHGTAELDRRRPRLTAPTAGRRSPGADPARPAGRAGRRRGHRPDLHPLAPGPPPRRGGQPHPCGTSTRRSHRWTDRLGLADDLWRGLAEGEDGELVDTLDPAAVEGYALAVLDGTRGWLDTADLGMLDHPPGDPGLDTDGALAALGAPEDRMGWLYDMWRGKPASFFLSWEAVGHGYNHLGELTSIRNRMGLSPF